MASCICQRAYDTGYTGVPAIDRRLQPHYDHGSLELDSFRRCYDHYHRGLPYKTNGRRPFCFVTKTGGYCEHEACDHARYRPTDLAAKVRYYIEHACPATAHYPRLELDEQLGRDAQWPVYGMQTWNIGPSTCRGGGTRDYGVPLWMTPGPVVEDNEKVVEEREAYEEALLAESHRFTPSFGKPRGLRCIPLETFLTDVATLLTGISPEADEDFELAVRPSGRGVSGLVRENPSIYGDLVHQMFNGNHWAAVSTTG